MKTTLRALLAVLCTSCFPTLEIPDGALVSCADSSECPPDYVCNTTGGICVRAGSDDFESPEISAVLRLPDRAAVGAEEVAVEFEVSEPLAAEPVVELIHNAAGVTLALQRDEGVTGDGVYRYTHSFDTQDPAGPYDLRISASD